MSKSVDLILSAVKSAGEAALRLHEESESLRKRLTEAEADNARLVAANKARDEFLRGHRYKHSEVDGYIDLCESQMADLKARLTEAEAKLLAWESAKPRCACGKVVIPILPHHGTADRMLDLTPVGPGETVRLQAENERLRAGLQLIAGDKHRLMNEVARQTAASILGGKPIGEVAEWPKRDVSHAQSVEEQRFLHGAAAVTGPDTLLQEIAMRALASGPTITLTLDEVRALYKFLPGAPECIAQEAAP